MAHCRERLDRLSQTHLISEHGVSLLKGELRTERLVAAQ